MDIREHSSKFTVYVFNPDVNAGAGIKVALSKAGYDCFYFQDAEVLETRMAEAAPHILIFSSHELDGKLNEFVEYVRRYNESIKFIVLADLNQFEVLSQYNAFGLEEILSKDSPALEAQALWATDRVCEKMYVTFQNEQLFEQWKEAQAKAKHTAGVLENTLVPKSDAAQKIVDYRRSQSKEEMIQRLMDRVNLPVIFFKFLPTVGSFIPTHSHSFDPAALNGAGSSVEKNEIKNLNDQLRAGELPSSLHQLLRENFKISNPGVLPLFVREHLEGLLVYAAQQDGDAVDRLREDFAVFSICYSHYVLEQKVDGLEVQDFVTEVYNRAFYLRTLNNEMDRARRLQQPLSVVKVAIDDFYEIEQAMGDIVRDRILKSLAEAIVKTSRTNDITCRTQMNEMAMVLPHCSRKGAALRAERMRRIIEGANLIDGGVKVSISLGISEYPSMCDSAQTLDETSSKALAHIADKGGNKICMYKAPDNHKPEFTVATE